MLGRVIFQENIWSDIGRQEITMNVYDLSKGIYFIALTDGEGASQVAKFVKQ